MYRNTQKNIPLSKIKLKLYGVFQKKLKINIYERLTLIESPSILVCGYIKIVIEYYFVAVFFASRTIFTVLFVQHFENGDDCMCTICKFTANTQTLYDVLKYKFMCIFYSYKKTVNM